ncbi:hypothetical protein HWI79_141 [Cryptosporidium felis]|nr:hypothetical protein HWI79_141 [Cryptosporidium felis]
MSKIKNKYSPTVHILYVLILIRICIFVAPTNERVVPTEINEIEEIVTKQGIVMPVTSSWQVMIALLSNGDHCLHISHTPNELFESKEQIEAWLEEPWRFYQHPASNITSTVLTHPVSEFLNFIYDSLDISSYTGNSTITNASSIKTKRNVRFCTLLIKSLIRSGFIHTEANCKFSTCSRWRLSEISECKLGNNEEPLGKAVNYFCEDYLSRLHRMLIGVRQVKAKGSFQVKLMLYHEINRLLEHT